MIGGQLQSERQQQYGTDGNIKKKDNIKFA